MHIHSVDDNTMVYAGVWLTLTKTTAMYMTCWLIITCLGETFMALARKRWVCRTCMVNALQRRRSVEGMLMMLGVRLEIRDGYCSEYAGRETSVFYQRKNSLRS